MKGKPVVSHHALAMMATGSESCYCCPQSNDAAARWEQVRLLETSCSVWWSAVISSIKWSKVGNLWIKIGVPREIYQKWEKIFPYWYVVKALFALLLLQQQHELLSCSMKVSSCFMKSYLPSALCQSLCLPQNSVSALPFFLNYCVLLTQLSLSRHHLLHTNASVWLLCLVRQVIQGWIWRTTEMPKNHTSSWSAF